MEERKLVLRKPEQRTAEENKWHRSNHILHYRATPDCHHSNRVQKDTSERKILPWHGLHLSGTVTRKLMADTRPFRVEEHKSHLCSRRMRWRRKLHLFQQCKEVVHRLAKKLEHFLLLEACTLIHMLQVNAKHHYCKQQQVVCSRR